MQTEPSPDQSTSPPRGLSVLWAARSIAVVGASERGGALGRLPVEHLLRYGYQGRILPVNPKARSVFGLTCYPTVAAAPGPVDLALLLVAAARVPEAIDDCAKAGVPVAIVGASGFAEAGDVVLQDEVVRRARARGVRVVGPNSIGAVGAANRQVVSFSPLFSASDLRMRDGRLGFVTQSGALGYGTVSLAYERGLGFGWIVNTGNDADVTAVEVLCELAQLDDCAGLLAYIETMTDGPAWRRLAELGKPVAVLKAGTSEAGARAATSHTGALAATDRVVDGVLRQLRIARAPDVDELLDIGEAFSRMRRPSGRSVAVVTTSGGSGILAADAIAAAAPRLRLAELSPRTTEALADVVPAFGSVENPVDVTATVMSDPTLFNRCLDLVADDEAVDSILGCFCVLTGADADHILAGLGRVARRSGKSVVVARTGADFLAPDARPTLSAAGIPVYATPARAVRALASVALTATRRPLFSYEGRHHSIGPPTEAQGGPEWPITEPELKALLRRAGLPVPRGRVVTDGSDAAAAVPELGGRAAFKAVVPGLLHKTEAGGVVLGVTAETAPRVYEEVAALGGRVYAEEMVSGGIEMLVGVAPTPLGRVITLGTGGVLTEVLDDAVFRLLPVGPADAEEMLAELRGAAVLRGARGRPPADIGALADLLVRVGALVAPEGVEGRPAGIPALPPDAELDLNPVTVLPKPNGPSEAGLPTHASVVILDAAVALA